MEKQNEIEIDAAVVSVLEFLVSCQALSFNFEKKNRAVESAILLLYLLF